jgi:hypothetical protein
MVKLSYNARRLILGLIWAPATFILLSNFAGLNWFGKYERDAVTISFVLLLVGVLFIGPSLSEMRQRREEQRKSSGPGENGPVP